MSPRRPPIARFRTLAGFRRDRRGATAVEFALVAAPLLLLLFSVLELALLFLISTTLESATYNAGRLIRTGQFQGGASVTPVTLKTNICSGLSWLGSACANSLEVDVRTYASFTNPSIPDPVSNGKFDTQALAFNPGNPGDIVLVRTFYKWTLVTPFLTGSLQRLSGGVSVITASSLFRNEPYS